jgi:glycosyltransferase involved in cell wall biosynthesis
MEIDYINGGKTRGLSGISKYQQEIHGRMGGITLNTIEYTPGKFMVRGLNIYNLLQMYLSYPLTVRKNLRKGNIKHITSHYFAYLLNCFHFENGIVTCYDLIPWIYEGASSPLNLRGLKKAGKIITISEFSKRDLIKYVGYPEEKIKVVYPAVDHQKYLKMNHNELSQLGTVLENTIILYVGSEQPRQNLPLLIKALAKLKKKLPEVKLLKIGDSQYPGARKNILKLIKDLNLEKNVIFLGQVTEDELPLWYNAADLLVYPCLYAGFGLPPLEAMACGTPVITSNTTSLPEVVGDAGVMLDPHDRDLWAESMYRVLTYPGLRDGLIKKGLKQAQIFNWDESARKTWKIYSELDHGK